MKWATVAVVALFLCLLVVASSALAQIPEPDPITYERVVLMLGRANVQLNAQLDYIDQLRTRILELQAEVDRLKVEKKPE